jgi:hypothetical protein
LVFSHLLFDLPPPIDPDFTEMCQAVREWPTG